MKPLLIGDSHVGLFHGSDDIEIFEVMGATAHNLIKADSQLQTGDRLFRRLDSSPREQAVLMWFGEIDCRLHFWHQHKKTGKPLEELVADTVGRYMRILDMVRSRGHEMAVMGVAPANDQPNVYNYQNYADLPTKCRIYSMFNAKLRDECGKVGYRYIDLLRIFANSKGAMRPQYTEDGVHLNAEARPIVLKILSEAGIVNPSEVSK